ncbi:MAG: dolichyl-diphosphooligosaccharide--protein glycosyltransferase subunit STT3, partial [Nitrosopumilus sp.]|nr:dolichyl-diphosphooligosaccharide--protein glycosyltransferase subunit STT3 [Nitrosopumilus sp.]
MNSNSSLLSIGKFDLRFQHLLIIIILSLSFSISFLIRSQPAEFGWELNEFDPFFNYRATQYIVDNGVDAYFNWNDDLSWHPNGRDISQNSQ